MSTEGAPGAEALCREIAALADPERSARAADTYYMTPYYEPHPVVLVRLAHIDCDALHDLLSMARRATLEKSARPRQPES